MLPVTPALEGTDCGNRGVRITGMTNMGKECREPVSAGTTHCIIRLKGHWFSYGVQMRVALAPKPSWKVHIEQSFKSGMLPGVVDGEKGTLGRGKVQGRGQRSCLQPGHLLLRFTQRGKEEALGGGRGAVLGSLVSALFSSH